MATSIPYYFSERELVVALQQREARAQKIAYEKYAGRMMAVCLRYVANRDDAEDVLIEGFMRVFDRIDQFRNEGSFEGWVRRVMVTESLMYLRKNKAWRQEVPLDDLGGEPDYELADANLDAEALIRLVSQLPDGYRTVFNLYAIEGYSHAEIAELTGISEGTSKSQLSRARALLQDKIRRLEIDYKPANHYGKAAS
ncbi:RNA polymerase, sigma-24 subunit, ECF subfamily [Fibrella aestuarina BUZ 2]|uniref:RNA polymerase, sigma-24 subunit, ECF subfamily n=1 Tax=Fibrella aestuarina BUZ 2 TaxID=1166018 RepID=I0K4P2_9BACT|nr:sigma-70 family RNA polymerase sigma factor [Fibrella aestuarina]CCG99095.1 RNA polymerase, sigma-24 subunit, ECF subfamily [Fibrella aestuarina BUZ 2]